MLPRNLIPLSLALTLSLAATSARAVQIVSDETIKTQKSLTTRHELKNGIPVVVREIPDSDIVAVNVTFGIGLKDLPVGKKVLNQWLWSAVTTSSAGYPKDKTFELVEKYALELGCGGGIEMAACSLGTLNDHWQFALPLLTDLITRPAFADDDVKLTHNRLVASLKNTASDPGKYINEVINGIFYPAGHPYRLNHDEALKELDSLTKADLVALHAKALNASRMQIVVVTSMPAARVVADLDKAFGAIGKAPAELVTPVAPTFDADNAFVFNDRDLPTAYIRIKLNGPSITDKDATAGRFVYELLSEELGEVVRTKRSLSYAVGSFLIQYSLGVGVISASTSKPRETIEAIGDVISSIQAKTFAPDELEEYKRTFATSYFQTLETHGSLAGALASSLFFYGTTDELYDMPRKLDAVTPADVKRLSGELLTDLRVGVIYGRKEFEDVWAKDLIRKTTRPASKTH